MSLVDKVKRLKNLKIINSQKQEEEILRRIDDELSAFMEAQRGLNQSQYGPFEQESRFEVKNNEFNLFFSKNRIKNKEVKDLLFSALDNVPVVDLSFEELFMIQDACWVKYGTDTLIQGIVDNYVDYIIGSGIVVDTPVPEVTQAIKNFRDLNQMSSKEREIVKHAILDGEYFNLLFHNNQTGDVIMRKAHPRTIEGIETSNWDIEVPYTYKQRFYSFDDQGNPTTIHKIRWLEDFNYKKMLSLGLNYQNSKHHGERVSNLVCLHLKLNDSDKLRGLPPLKRVLKWSKIYENFILDRMVLNHERAKVVWIKSIMQRTKDALKREFRSPEGGTMLIEKEGIKYRTEKPNLDSSEAKEDALNLLYYIGSGVRFPLHILNQRTDQQVYASIQKAETPFAKMIESHQSYYSLYFDKIYRFYLSKQVKARRLKQTYSYAVYSEEAILLALDTLMISAKNKENIEDIRNKVNNILDEGKTEVKVNTIDLPISQDFQQMMWQDPKEMAEVLKIHNEIGIAAKATLSAKAGYSFKRELPKLLAENKLKLELERTQLELQKEYALEPKKELKK